MVTFDFQASNLTGKNHQQKILKIILTQRLFSLECEAECCLNSFLVQPVHVNPLQGYEVNFCILFAYLFVLNLVQPVPNRVLIQNITFTYKKHDFYFLSYLLEEFALILSPCK